MIIYNVTTRVDKSIHQEWLTWLQDEHIPALLATQCFTKATVLRLLEMDESDGPTYAVQYQATDRQHYQQFIENFEAAMQQRSRNEWGNSALSFETVMQVVN